MTRRIWADKAEQDRLFLILTNLVICLNTEQNLLPETAQYHKELKDFVREFWGTNSFDQG